MAAVLLAAWGTARRRSPGRRTLPEIRLGTFRQVMDYVGARSR
jgi:hypothetical protein